jgi:nucleotide-binding universal stress UspA family protein
LHGPSAVFYFAINRFDCCRTRGGGSYCRKKEEGAMTFKNVLVPMEMHDSVASVLECAALTAKRFSSHVEGVAVRPNYAGFIAVDPIGVAAFPELDEQVAEQARECRRSFETDLKARDVSHGWSAREPLTESGAAALCRIFDLAVLGRPANRDNGPRMSLFETMLFESGRPMILAPHAPPKSLGDTVVIAWNQSTETARATAFAMPFLVKARRVVVLTVEGGVVPGPTGAELASHLKRHGLPAEERTVQPGRRSHGEALVAEASALGCDLLIKGAYTQSRLRQMIFGGMTSHILTAAEMPVFMSH